MFRIALLVMACILGILLLSLAGVKQILALDADAYIWAENPPKIRLSKLFERLQGYTKAKGYNLRQLYPFQRKSIRKIFRPKNLLVVVRTGGGKTIVGFACLWRALMNRRIGVYLVPQNQLLAQKLTQIKQFFGNFAHVVTLSGEYKPSPTYLRRHRRRLILVGTYEAFRAFLFLVQSREYFPQQRCFGGVVVDEIHTINNGERGPKLETMIYKLQQEHASQLCLLSATFNKKSAEVWSRRLKCDLIHEDPARTFQYEEIVITAAELEDKQETESLEMTAKTYIQTLIREEKKNRVIELIERFIEAREDASYFPPKLHPSKMLIFCYSRDSAEQMAQAIDAHWGFATDVHCDYIHAGIDRADQRDIFDEFNKPEGIRLLCTSPLLETGVDVERVEAIIVMNPERYDSIRLAQMCGRTREEMGRVIFIYFEDYREKVWEKLHFIEGTSHSEFKGFALEPIESRISTNDVESWLTLEMLFGHELTRKQLEGTLAEFRVKFDVDEILAPENDLIKRSFIRQSGGRYGLTYLGIATVESGLHPDEVIECLELFDQIKKMGEIHGRSKQFSVRCRELIGRLVANRAYSEPALHSSSSHVVWRLLKRLQLSRFIYHYNSENPRQTEIHQHENEIKDGDAEIFRRTALWIASSLYALYQGYELHWMAENSSTQYYQILVELALEEASVFYRRFLRLINRYQRPDETHAKKPPRRPHPVYMPNSQYKAPIITILEESRSKGLLKQEIKQKLRKEFNIVVPAASIHSTLNQTLKGEIRRQLEPTTEAHRPPHRYWLKQHKPRRTEKKGLKVERKKKKPHLIHDFEIVDEQVKCPACKKLRTVQIPTPDRLTRCKACKAVFRRTRWGRYKWRDDCRFDEDQIEYDKGFPYVKIAGECRLVFLKDGEVLHVRHKKSGSPYFSIMGRGGAYYYPDQVYEVVLAGGQIGSGHELLKKYRIRVKQLNERELERVRNEEDVARKIRDAISSLEGTSRLKKARDLILTKILSNLYYTFKLEEYLPAKVLPRKKVQDLALKQYDHLTKVLLALEEKHEIDQFVQVVSTLAPVFTIAFGLEVINPVEIDAYYSAKYIAKLRSQEGNAEIAAWDAVKRALPKQFQFSSRQAQRLVRTDLYWGPKARDPFNCALNFLYYLLGNKAALALEQAGFSRYYPGPGIIHKRRRTRKKRRWVESRENREFLYDFIDTFRAPFRYHLVLAFQKNKDPYKKNSQQDLAPLANWHCENVMIKEDFFHKLDEWGERVYFPTEEGEEKLRQLFRLICSHPFVGGSKEQSLEASLYEEAVDFSHFFLENKEDHLPFRAFEDEKGATRVLAYFTLISQFMEYDTIPVIQEDLLEVPALESLPILDEEIHPEIVILITHNDFDGFASGLLLLMKYYHVRNLYLIIAENNPHRPFHISRVLEKIVPKLIRRKASNAIIVADFPISEPESFFFNLRALYLTKLKWHEERLRIKWFDHHSRPAFDPTGFPEGGGIEFHHIPDERRHVYWMLWDFCKEEFAKENPKKRPWDFFAVLNLSKNGWFAKKDDPYYLNKWYAWFREYYLKPTRRPKNWVRFFKDICAQKQPPEIEEILPNNIIFHGSIHQTKDGKTFTVLIFRDYFDIRNVKGLLQAHNQMLPDFVICYWVNHSISLRVFHRDSVNLQGLLESQGIGGHLGAGAIYTPRQKVYQIGSLYFYSYLFIDQFVEWISDSVLTGDSGDLFQGEIIDIPPQAEEEWVETWELEEDQRKQLESSYGYKTTIAYMPEYSKEIREKLAEVSIPFVSSSVKDKDEFEKGTELFELEFQPGMTLSFPLNDVILFFSEWRDRRNLFRFLYSFLIKHEQKGHSTSGSGAPKILYIDTLKDTLSFKQFIDLAAPLSTLENIIFTKISDLPILESFIKDYLSSMIEIVRTGKDQGIEREGTNLQIIVINSLFDLINAHFDAQKDQSDSKTARAKKITELVRELRKIARNKGVTMLLTSVGATFDPEKKVYGPSLFKRVRPLIKHKIHVKQKRKRIHLQVQEGSKWISHNLPRPLDKAKKDVTLADFSQLSEMVDFTFLFDGQ